MCSIFLALRALLVAALASTGPCHHVGDVDSIAASYCQFITPKGVPHPAMCNARATREVPSSKLKEQPPHRKIGVTSNLPVGRISVVTLIRTDTTLDHSQKAEKV